MKWENEKLETINQVFNFVYNKLFLNCHRDNQVFADGVTTQIIYIADRYHYLRLCGMELSGIKWAVKSHNTKDGSDDDFIRVVPLNFNLSLFTLSNDVDCLSEIDQFSLNTVCDKFKNFSMFDLNHYIRKFPEILRDSTSISSVDLKKMWIPFVDEYSFFPNNDQLAQNLKLMSDMQN